MWVYKGESLRSRLVLPEETGFWLDYWLFLHAEETPPTWSVRPLGLQAVATEGLLCRGQGDAKLREQLATEVTSSAGLIQFLPRIPKPPSSSPTEKSDWKKNWQKEWMRWFETVIREYEHSEIISGLGRAIALALSSRNSYQASFLIRRLGAELGQHDWSRAQLFGVAKKNFCSAQAENSGTFDPDTLQQRIVATFVPTTRVSFVVRIPLVPAVVSRDVLKRFTRPKLCADQALTGEWVLRAVEITVEAVHSEEAAAKARASARGVIERLRLRHYIRTGIAGDAVVTRQDTAAVFNVRMPQPFWSSPQSFRRDIPGLPKNYPMIVAKLPEHERACWRAAQWHVSQAIATWGEDTHSAASEIWQALEAFAGVQEGGGWKAVLGFVSQYARLSVLEMARHIAIGVTQQTHAITSLGEACDWFWWNSEAGSADRWLKKITNPRSGLCYRNWMTPPLPLLLSDRNVGLLGVIFQEIRRNKPGSWVERRLVSDLRLLYALRNKVVHRGERIFGERAAMYLAQVGIELLFGVMQLRRDTVLTKM
jgi:hypothetical protein